MNTFPTKEELTLMPLIRLRQLDIKSKEEEEVVQEILSSRLSTQPVEFHINFIVPDIKNVEEEKMWQARIDEARNKQQLEIAMQGVIEGAEIEIPTSPDATPTEDIVLPEESVIAETVVEPEVPQAKKKGRPKKVKSEGV